jgi:DNA polymerase III delta subunit
MRKYIRKIDPSAKEADAFKDLIVRFQNVGLFRADAPSTYFIFNDKSAQEMEIKDIIRIIGDNTVILIYDSADMRTKFFKSAGDYTYEFPHYTSQELAYYIRTQIEIDPDLAVVLSELCNNEVAHVDMECDKLNRLDARITREILHEIITKRAEDVIFDMIRSVAVRDVQSVYAYLAELLERRESPIKIVSILYTTLRNVLLIQSYSHLSNAEIAGKTGLSFGQIHHQRDLIGRFTLEDLKDNLIIIQQAETNIKTGKLDQITALDVLLLDILR